MGDNVTFADLRAMIAARGLDSQIRIIGDYSNFDRLTITREELEVWLDETMRQPTKQQIKITVRRRHGRLWELLDNLWDPGALRFSGKGLRGGGRR